MGFCQPFELPYSWTESFVFQCFFSLPISVSGGFRFDYEEVVLVFVRPRTDTELSINPKPSHLPRSSHLPRIYPSTVVLPAQVVFRPTPHTRRPPPRLPLVTLHLSGQFENTIHQRTWSSTICLPPVPLCLPSGVSRGVSRVTPDTNQPVYSLIPFFPRQPSSTLPSELSSLFGST